MRVMRVGLIAAGVLLAIVVIGALGLVLFVHPDAYRPQIERAVQARTGRALTLNGPLGLSVFPRLALTVDDARLGNPPGFGSTPFVAVRRVRLGVRLLPLLAKRLDVSDIVIDGLSVDLVSRGESNNWSNLGGSAPPAASAPATSGGALAQGSIAGIDVSNVSLVYRDEVKHTVTAVTDLSVNTGAITSTSADGVVLKGLKVSGKWASGPSGPSSAPVPFSLRASELALNLAAQTAAAPKIDMQFGTLPLSLSVTGQQLLTERILTGDVKIPKSALRPVLSALGIALPVMRDPHAMESLALAAQYRVTKKQLLLSGLDLTLDQSRMTGSAGIDDLDTLALRYDLAVNAIDLDRYRAPLPPKPARPARAPQTAAVKPSQPLPVEFLRKLDVHGVMKVGQAAFAGMALSNLVMPLEAKSGRVHLGPLQAALYGGTYNGDIVLDAQPQVAHLTLDQHLRGTDIGAVLKASQGSTFLAGRADANLAASGVGNADEDIMRSLAGKLDAAVSNGALNGVDIPYEVSTASSLLKRQSLPPRPQGPARTPFNTLRMTGTIDKGVVHNDDVRVETDLLKMHGRGTLDLVTQAINYQLVTEVYGLPAGGGSASRTAVASAGRPLLEVPLVVTGTDSAPIVRPDLEALAKGQLRDVIQQKLGLKSDDVRKKLGDSLQQFLPH